MTQGRTRTAALALALAMLPAEAAAQISEGLRLRLERQMRMAPVRPDRDSAKFLEADRIVSDADRNVTATGEVVLRQRGAVVRADRVDYHDADQSVVATGHVRLERDGDVAAGPRLNYQLDAGTGEMDSPVFEFPKRPERRTASRGQAARAVLEGDQKSRLYQAEYTSCPVPRDDWFIRVRELELDTSRNVGTAYNTTVFFLGVPILYSPYLSFPLDNRRKTGFLAPTFGTSARSGFEVSLPYYWNLAENYDATVTPKVLTRRGVQLGGEFRYLTPSMAGEIEGEFLPHDRVAGTDRSFMAIRHAQQLGHGFSFTANAQRVSDDAYFRDLSTRIALTSQTNLPRDAVFAYNDDTWSASARALGYQTLQDPAGPPIPIPYNILPQLLANGSRQNVYGFDWQFAGDYSNFRHPVLVNGQRVIAYPSIAYPLRRSYGYVIPKIGYHFTHYNLDNNNATRVDAENRGLPIASLDSGLFFERQATWAGRSFVQTLEPRLFYLDVPFKDQSHLPNFTTAEADFNFQRFFSENRFVGGDRIGDANQLTMAVTSRLIESATGLERFKAAIGQVYYFRPPRVTLGDTPPPSKSSDILGYASSQMSPSVALEAAWQYTPNLQRSEKITVGGRYSPEPGSVVNAAYRYVRGNVDSADPSRQGIQQVDLSTQWPVTRNLSALARWNWSTKDRKLLEGLAGFEYNAGCWQVRAVAHRFITATQQYSTSFQIQLELSGLSRIGINPLETLRQNIGGYRRSDEIAP
ncbi:MAG TPA: LPS-assembly protein LptD [Usitatibacter sp.]|nr:LPS-assembly protein LptD [Usitatibacter sp.]